MASSITYAKNIVSLIFNDAGDYPTKIILQLPPLDNNSISGWQVYPDTTYSRKSDYQQNIWTLRTLLIDEFSKPEYANKVYIGQAGCMIDRIYGYAYETRQSSSRIPINEIYHTNCVHPSDAGYKQLGDAYFLQIVSLLK